VVQQDKYQFGKRPAGYEPPPGPERMAAPPMMGNRPATVHEVAVLGRAREGERGRDLAQLAGVLTSDRPARVAAVVVPTMITATPTKRQLKARATLARISDSYL
jgi:hypothetical protein